MHHKEGKTMASKPHATLNPQITDSILLLIKRMKEDSDPKATMDEFASNNSIEDFSMHQDLLNILKEAGFYNSGHFVEVVVNTDFETLKKANENWHKLMN